MLKIHIYYLSLTLRWSASVSRSALLESHRVPKYRG